jgi:hypothetical protein
MSDPPAETPTGAARALIAWFAGGLAFDSIALFERCFSLYVRDGSAEPVYQGYADFCWRGVTVPPPQAPRV